MKNNMFYLIGILIMIAGAGFFISGNGKSGDLIGGPSGGDVQEVVLSFKDYNYYPNTIKVKAGQPVRISLDESVFGCYRSFTIRDFGVGKYLQTPEDYVEFTPNKKGTFRFSCSMGMGTGTLIVE